MMNPLAQDLDHILAHTEGLWEELRGQRIFITGGTGFFGCWLLESFCWANDRLSLGAEALVLTRNPGAFRHKAPHLATHPAVTLHVGDIRRFEFPAGQFSHVIHAATEASARLNAENPLLMLDTIIEGTRHTLDFAVQCGARRFLLTSSGAVYGPQPAELTHIPEDYHGAPNPLDPASAYGEGKRVAEHLCALCHQRTGVEMKIARCFAFVGPYMPLGGRFAAGNFIRDVLRGGPVVVAGDGTASRSYLYAADLVIWLWTILLHGRPGQAYNVGASAPISILELARMAARLRSPPLPTEVSGRLEGRGARCYVPSATKALTELGLRATIDLPEAMRRTLLWYGTVSDLRSAMSLESGG